MRWANVLVLILVLAAAPEAAAELAASSDTASPLAEPEAGEVQGGDASACPEPDIQGLCYDSIDPCPNGESCGGDCVSGCEAHPVRGRQLARLALLAALAGALALLRRRHPA